MYRITDEAFAIREVQRFLLIIAERESSIPIVPVDGIYGEDTRVAVTEFQKIKAIDATGTVNKETFELLFFEADDIINEKKNRAAVIESEKFPLKLGDSGTDVSLLNTLIRHLSKFYKDIYELPHGSFFSRETENAVKIIQGVFREEKSGTVSENLLALLRSEVVAREKFSNFP